jgi:D-alanyl-D-alanine carboxypeptidase/D-alanyl-D-alanine-endopeptidase (penicillin-binding protein 4)
MKKTFAIVLFLLCFFPGSAQTHPAIDRFIRAPFMSGASVSLLVKDVHDGSIVYSYDAERELIPASVLKLVTTATAFELLGENFRYETVLLYDGHISDGVLHGNLYIRGSGDPTLGSRDTDTDRNKIVRQWIRDLKQKGISKITGSVIADESVFDTEGTSMKWLREDLGSHYGQGCYGLNFHDNRYTLFLNTETGGEKPDINRCEPDIPDLFFHNYIKTNTGSKDSAHIVGFPYSNERYLYGTVPAGRSSVMLRGDIPEPALFLAQYLTKQLEEQQIVVNGAPTCHRILSTQGKWQKPERLFLTASYSPRLREMARTTHFVSSNLYADALLKTIGLAHRTDKVVSSFEKGIYMLHKHWNEKDIQTSALWMFDGSGLALTDKLTARFLSDLLSYMATKSAASKAFIESIPRAGMDGTVAGFLKGNELQGKARLKSGSMSRVRSYAGYVTKDHKQYAVVILVNNFSCKQTVMRLHIEQLLKSLF